MSYDELPPDESVRPNKGAAPSAEAEESVADAPSPAAASRPRRTRRTGNAAASAPEEVVIAAAQEKPVRAPRTRRKPSTAEETGQPAAPEPPAESVAPSVSQEANTPTAKPKSLRRTRKQPNEETTVSASEPVSVPADVPETAPKRRTRRPKAEETVDTQAVAVTPAPIEAAPIVEKKPVPRQRMPRTRQKAAEPETPIVEIPPAPTSEQAEPETFSPEAKTPARRSRRTKATPEPIAASVEVSPDAQDEAAATEQTETAETDERRSSRRRNRRGGRARRGNTPDRPDVEADSLVSLAEAEQEAPFVEPEEEPVDISIGAHLLRRGGVPQIHINGKPYPPVFFFGNMEGDDNRAKVLSEVRRAAKANVHLHSTLVDLPCPLTEASHALDEIDIRLKAILEADPNGFVMPRVQFYPAKGWKREYPTEFAAYADGTTGDPAFTSERFWSEAERSLEMLISHIQGQEWGRRVFGYHLERGEWFQPADLGYDRSNANRDAFRDWLRVKYKDDMVRLRAAWYNGEVQFHTADIPAPIAKPNPQQAFYEMRRQRNTVDFQEFTSETTANRLIRLAKVVKEATGRQALVSACYGYTLEFGHGFSGHLALSKVLESPAIDLLTGPPSYRDRKPGGAASLPAPTDSLQLHGKLWLSEDDTKTYLAPIHADDQDYNPRLTDRFLTEQAHGRAIGRAFANRSGIGFMDLWGEGWLDDEGLWNAIDTFTARYDNVMGSDAPLRTPDVIALIDERSLLHLQRGEPFFRRLTAEVRNTLQRAGISYALHLQTDVLHEAFPTDAKLYLFLTPYRLPTDVRTAIKDKLQNGNKTLAFLYAPGTCDATPFFGGVMEEGATAAIGITLRPQEWNAEIGTRFIEQSHPLTQSLPGRELGSRERLNPSFYVDDDEATALGEYIGSGMTSVAVKNCGTWKSVFIGEPVLPLELLRGICRYANVPIWTPRGDDVALIGNGFVTIHAGREGQRTLNLPKNFFLYDLTENRMVLENGREYRWFQRAGSTRQFAYGSREQLAALGLVSVNQPEQRRRPLPEERVERRPPPAAFSQPPTMRQEESEDVETLAFDFSLFKRDESDGTTRETPRMTLRDVPIPVEPEPEPMTMAPDDAKREDLKTLEAVLNMSLSDFADELPPMSEGDSPLPEFVVTPSLITASVSSALAGLLETDITGTAKRRRRRGGRGRGKKRADGTDDLGDDSEDDNETAGDAEFAPPERDDNEDE